MAKNRPAKKDNNKEKKGKKEKGVGKRMKKEAMIQAIISVFQSSPKEPFNYKQISKICLLYTSPSPRDLSTSRMPSSA